MKIDKKQIAQSRKQTVKRITPGKKNLSFKALKADKSVNVSIPGRELQKLVQNLRPALSAMRIPESSELHRALPPLQEILSILQSDNGESPISDRQLLERFLTSWLDRYGVELPTQQRKELTELVNVFRNMNSDNSLYIISGPAGEQSGNWRLIVDPDFHDRSSGDDDESVNCRLDLSTENLGDLSVNISRGKGEGLCLFASSRDSIRSLLRKSMALFRKQLNRHGMAIPLLKVGSPAVSQKPLKEKATGGVDLWG